MANFLGSHSARLDTKGRVLIPVSFRAHLKNGDGFATMVARPSDKHRCVECWPHAEFDALERELEPLSALGEDREDWAAALYADATHLESDKEGRIVIPVNLSSHARITDTVVFMGLGKTFQIWEPAAAEARRTEARERVAALRGRVGGAP